jgi:hypothetical protein
MLLEHRAVITDNVKGDCSWINLACPKISDLKWTIENKESFKNNKPDNVFVHKLIPLVQLVVSKEDVNSFLLSFRVGAIIGIANQLDTEPITRSKTVLVVVPNKNKCVSRLYIVQIHNNLEQWLLENAHLQTAVHSKKIELPVQTGVCRLNLFMLQTSLFSFTDPNTSAEALQEWWKEDSFHVMNHYFLIKIDLIFIFQSVTTSTEATFENSPQVEQSAPSIAIPNSLHSSNVHNGKGKGKGKGKDDVPSAERNLSLFEYQSSSDIVDMGNSTETGFNRGSDEHFSINDWTSSSSQQDIVATSPTNIQASAPEPSFKTHGLPGSKTKVCCLQYFYLSVL